MPNTIYTAGYTGLTPALLLDAAKRLDAVLVDVRISPRSRHPMWNGAALAKEWGERYAHIKALGNKNYKGDYGEGIMLLDSDAGVKQIAPLLEKRSVILLCACEHWETCHRRDAAEVVGERTGLKVVHLSAADIKQPQPPAQQLTLL